MGRRKINSYSENLIRYITFRIKTAQISHRINYV
jgi:hypothetical protein